LLVRSDLPTSAVFFMLPRRPPRPPLFPYTTLFRSNSANRDLVLFGVLIRDQAVRETDLQARGRTLAGRLQAPSCCRLLALYLPWPIAQLPARVGQGGGV